MPPPAAPYIEPAALDLMPWEAGGQSESLSVQESQAQPDSPLISQASPLKGQARSGRQRKQRFQSIGPPIAPGIEGSSCSIIWSQITTRAPSGLRVCEGLSVCLNSHHLPKAANQNRPTDSRASLPALQPIPHHDDHGRGFRGKSRTKGSRESLFLKLSHAIPRALRRKESLRQGRYRGCS